MLSPGIIWERTSQKATSKVNSIMNTGAFRGPQGSSSRSWDSRSRVALRDQGKFSFMCSEESCVTATEHEWLSSVGTGDTKAKVHCLDSGSVIMETC